jgi:quinohemoprotein amine dehydrogenase
MRNFALITQSALLFSASVCVAAASNIPQNPIPVNDEVTIAKCGGCHRRSESGVMTRISYMRTTPEVWEQALKRMVRLNGVSVTTQEASHIVRYLSANNGLAPEEAKPIFWEAEHRLFRDQDDPELVPAALQRTCNTCHTIGRVLTQRRTREDYQKLANMHVGLFPYTDIMVFRPYPPSASLAEMPVTTTSVGLYDTVVNYPKEPDAPPGGKAPIDVALDYLADQQPLVTPEWSAWKAVMHTPKLEGAWLVDGYQKGKGRVFGQMVIEATASGDDFTTKLNLKYASSGREIKRTGKGIVYTGYSWRGRSKVDGSAADDPGFSPAEMKEAMFISRDGSIEGRWFWGGYDEFGIDVHLTRLGTGIVLHGTDKFSVRSPSKSQLRVFGANIPSAPKPDDFDLGPGVKVTRIAESKPTEVLLEIEVASGVAPGMHDVAFRGATAVKSFAVYDRISYIKVMPDASFARLGGTIAAKQFAQFEAVAFANGPDGQPGTDDDLELGPVTANWSLEEFISGPNDDDVKYVGTVNDSGLFTPSFEGPNPERKKQSNNFGTDNYGDVWVSASFKPEGGSLLKARSYLVVTVPLYVHYDQPEVSR